MWLFYDVAYRRIVLFFSGNDSPNNFLVCSNSWRKNRSVGVNKKDDFRLFFTLLASSVQ